MLRGCSVSEDVRDEIHRENIDDNIKFSERVLQLHRDGKFTEQEARELVGITVPKGEPGQKIKFLKIERQRHEQNLQTESDPSKKEILREAIEIIDQNIDDAKLQMRQRPESEEGLIKNTKAIYFTNTLNDCDNNPKKMWKTINKLTNKQSKTTVISEIQNDNQNLNKKHEIADALNSHFNEVASRLVNNMPQSSRTFESYVTRSDTQFTIQNVSLTKVYKLLSTIKTSKSAGHDRIPGKLLRDAAEVIAPSLSAIFNASINTGIFPEDFKIAIISPIHKTGSKTNCDNYRPISVLSSVAKIYEKLVTEQLEIYLETNHILAEQQAGFRKNHSTQTSLLYITNQWLMNMDKGLLNGVIFLDLKKAFDCVDHNILLKKMHCYGIRGHTLAWFQSYLSSRIQICKVDQTMSKTRTVKCGIPQGSNLGPLLFLLYINDLPNCLTSSSASMFADDTNVSTNGKTNDELQERINVDLENIHQWLLANKLTLNKDKTEYMIIGSRQRISNLVLTDPKIELGESVIKQVHKSKTLGVIIDEHLLWNHQIQNIVTKASKGIGMMRRIKHHENLE
ncbi:Hypothetical predicted protein [Paramuricea clavata]|uniref:Uncharacterized protein n=1 Tax=Paramuricea clavata TaxID=317549 RepID=A0A6S7GJR2_PARCT|nr:Hypothetical predicted protein [Paramuricea clavata]